jgi:putative redox protein
MSKVKLRWIESTLMTGVDSRGQSLVMGRWEDHDPPWQGLKPSDLLLLAAASCSSWDVITILEKQRQPMQALEVTCNGDQAPDPPHVFTSLHLHFTVHGAVDADKVEWAISLSMEKYCSVINSLDSSVNITTDFEIIE